ncbi:hypothetical protein RRF57_005740 [Xylaria bambusicola]|uniref:Uncharacterized protein n=1 Tax=Xylaria bambusicola TaxID=326684 RepID=A0AAN7UD48_9PEZI
MVAAIIGIPVLAYVMLPSSPAATGKPAANPGLPPNLDPAARKREKDSDEPDIPKVHAPRA